MIELFDDFRDILIELHHAGTRFVVLGGHAVAFHGHPRATKDLDILQSRMGIHSMSMAARSQSSGGAR